MLDEFEKSSSNNIVRLRVISEPERDNNCVTLTLSPENPELTNEEFRPIKYEIKVPYKLGDGNTDYYHPYLRVGNPDEAINVKIENETITQKHVTKIKRDDSLEFEKYYFDFVFLDSNVRRFDVGKERRHWLFTESENKPKPYLLWDVDDFERLRKLIADLDLTTTQIMNLYEMLISKLNEWEIRKPPAELLNSENKENKEKAKVFERLVDNAIKSTPLRLKVVESEETRKGRITKEDYEFLKNLIMSGLFFDFVDLWHTILKRDFGGDGNA